MGHKYLDPIERMRALITELGSQKAAAEQLEISQAYFSDILNGRRDLSDAMLEKLGLVRVELFVDNSA